VNGEESAVHPMLKPALRRAWRERQTVQFGVTPGTAVTVGPVDTATGMLLELLDGTRGLPLLRKEARAIGVPEGRVDALVERLAEAGLLDDPRAAGPVGELLRGRPGVPGRLRPDLASLSVCRREPGGAMRALAARRGARVQVRGSGRVGALVASLLSSAGVGTVEALDGGCVEESDVIPGGHPGESVGERRDSAARRLVRGAAPFPPHRSPAGGGPAGRVPGLSLVVVCPRDGLDAHAPDPVVAADWIASGTPHLYAGVIEATGVVGPLVLPGGSACAGCLQLARTAADPGWPRLLAQWRSGGRRRTATACDVTLAAAVAGTAAAHALSFLDGELPASVGARWEAGLPEMEWRSEPVAPQVGCSCGAPGKSEGEDPSGIRAPHATMTGATA
jgi:bacteriocin biosynthesis cyclodehydratase domain-containing protein